ncbi:MAG: beta-ketoacyl synthase chain length factor [Bdellovibrionota bacterium]
MDNVFYIKKYLIFNSEEIPVLDFVSPLIRRRLTEIEKIGLFILNNLLPYDENLKLIFASEYGEWQETIKLIEQTFKEKEMSPAGFSHSVHNAILGMASIIYKNKCNYTTIAANKDTLDCAIIEAISSKEDTLLIYAEEATPRFYKPIFKNTFYGHGVGFILSRNDNKENNKKNNKENNKENSEARKICITLNKEPLSTSITFNNLACFLNNKSVNSLNGKYATIQSSYIKGSYIKGFAK